MIRSKDGIPHVILIFIVFFKNHIDILNVLLKIKI